MPGRSIKVLRIAGIPLGVQPMWLVIVGLITWSLGADYYPAEVHRIAPVAAYALGLLSALLLFVSIVAHEFGHALIARRCGIQIDGIDLWLLGGVAKMRGEPRRAQDELRFALAGPLVTLVFALVFAGAALLLPSSTPRAVQAVVGYQAYVNAAILVFNLLPAFPLDGGRVLRALLWRRSGDMDKATGTAAAVGRGFGWLFVAVGLIDAFAGVASGLWLAVVGFFVLMAAGAERRQAELDLALGGYRAADLMASPAIAIESDVSLADAAVYFTGYRFTSFPVTTHGRVTGLLTLAALEAVPEAQWAATHVGEIAEHDPTLFVHPEEGAADVVAREAFARDGRAVVVDDADGLVGILSLTDVERALRVRRLRTLAQQR